VLHLTHNNLGAHGWLARYHEAVGPSERRGGPLPFSMKRLLKLAVLDVEDNPHLMEPPPDVIQTGDACQISRLAS
jgi:hypothetical protein